MERVAVREGNYLMGVPPAEGDLHADEAPQHEVSIQAFHIARTEITRAQWADVAALPKINRELDPDPSTFKAERRLPVHNVSCTDPITFSATYTTPTSTQPLIPTNAQ